MDEILEILAVRIQFNLAVQTDNDNNSLINSLKGHNSK